MRADAGNFDDRRLRRKACGARGALDGIGNRSGSGFTDRATLFADQKHDGIRTLMTVHTSDEGVSAFDAVHDSLLAQEIERAIDGDWRRPRASHSQTIDQLIGA